jgi:phage protein D
MPGTFQLLFDGSPVDDELYRAISTVEVEENLDLPDAIQLTIAVSRTEAGELDYPSDKRLRPFANVAVVATPEGGADQCIFDGFVLSHKLHLQTGVTASTLEVWGQDSSWLMNLEETVREWVDMTDAQVAASIFGDYGITPSDDNTEDDSPTHTEDGHSLMQRGSDIRFLRDLARRNGKFCRVACTDKPGQRTGYFCKPNLDGDPVAVIKLNDPAAPTADSLDLEWDVARPSAVGASQALFNDDSPEGISADTDNSGLDPLDEQDLATFAGKPMTVLLTTPVDDAGELAMRAQSVLREGGWFARCEGAADVARIGVALRVNTLVQLDGLGALDSGTYLVWSVRHTITTDAHRMRFVLYRNAMGASPSGGATLGGFP